MIDEILGFHEPVIIQRQETLPASAAPRQGAAQPFVSLPPLYPQTRIMANVQMKTSRKANAAAC
jgi:hypothetical protein